MAAPHTRGKGERARRLAKIAKLERQGYTQAEIAKMLGCTQPAVSVALTKVRNHYLNVMEEDVRVSQGHKSAQVMDVFREAVKGWKHSWGKIAAELKQELLAELAAALEGEEGVEELLGLLKTKGLTVRVQAAPRNEFLQTMLSCVSQWRAIHGLDAPKQVDMKHSGGVSLDWTQLVQAVGEDETEDKIEKELLKMLNGEVVDAQPVEQPKIPYGLKEEIPQEQKNGN